jgi:hypothetical protein
MFEYQQDLMVLAYALSALIVFGAGLLCLRYADVLKRRPEQSRASRSNNHRRVSRRAAHR